MNWESIFKWVLGAIIAVLSTIIGYLYDEVKDAKESSIQYTDKIFERQRVDQQVALDKSIKDFNRSVSGLRKEIERQIQEREKDIEMIAAAVDGQNAEFKNQIHSLGIFSQNTRSQFIDLKARIDERR